MTKIRHRAVLLLSSVALAGLAGCGLPHDARNTLEAVRGDTLFVGVSEAPPWVIRPGEAREPAGVEAELVRGFARSLDAEVVWLWGPPAEHMEALARFDIHLAIGGFTRGNAWAKHVGTTQGYYETVYEVGTPPGGERIRSETELENRRVYVRRGHPIASFVADEDAEVVEVEELTGLDGFVVSPYWELEALGYQSTGVNIHKVKQVMAAPPGENGFIFALEDYLHGQDIRPLIQRAVDAESGGGA